MDLDPLTNEDVADILALLDSLPYDELDLQTPRFRLTLRRTPGGWTQSTQILSAPEPVAERAGPGQDTHGIGEANVTSEAGGEAAGDCEGPADRGGDRHGDGDGEEDAGLVPVRAPLPGTFYRAPRPGAAPFVEVGSRVDADTVIGIVETMKLMNSVPAGVAGVVAGFCVANAEFAAQGAALLRIRADQ
jgi:acetyl-CoA carboxylase biotin carboxyl carrier protein